MSWKKNCQTCIKVDQIFKDHVDEEGFWYPKLNHYHVTSATRVHGNLSSLGWVILKGFNLQDLKPSEFYDFHLLMADYQRDITQKFVNIQASQSSDMKFEELQIHEMFSTMSGKRLMYKTKGIDFKKKRKKF